MSDAPDTALVKAVREKLSKPEAWTRGEMARDIDGEEIWPWRVEAVAWSLGGAIRWALNWVNVEDRPTTTALAQALGFVDLRAADDWNDAPERTHADILERLDAVLKGEGK